MLQGWGQQVPLGYLGQEAEKGVGEGLAGQCRLMGPGTEVRMGLVRGVCSSAPGPAHPRNGCPDCTTLGSRDMNHLHWGLQLGAGNAGSLLRGNPKSPTGSGNGPSGARTLCPRPFPMVAPLTRISRVRAGSVWQITSPGLWDRKHLGKVTQRVSRSPGM